MSLAYYPTCSLLCMLCILTQQAVDLHQLNQFATQCFVLLIMFTVFMNLLCCVTNLFALLYVPIIKIQFIIET